jgi:hypothetical protein
MKVGGGSEIVEKNRSRRGVEKNKKRIVEYSAIGYKVTVTFIIMFKMCRREGI